MSYAQYIKEIGRGADGDFARESVQPFFRKIRLIQDQADDRHAGQVLHPAKAIGELVAGLPPREHKGDPERDGRGGIADVVNRIGQERHTAGDEDDEDLEDRRAGQNDEGPLDGPDAALGRRDRRVDHAMGVGMPAVVAMPVATMGMAHRVTFLTKAQPVHCRAPHRSFSPVRHLQVTADLLEVLNGDPLVAAGRPDRVFEAMLDMVVDQGRLRLFQRTNHGVHLLGDIRAVPTGFHHAGNRLEMARGPTQTVDDVLVAAVGCCIVAMDGRFCDGHGDHP